MKRSIFLKVRQSLTIFCVVVILFNLSFLSINARAATTLSESSIRNYLNGKNGKTESNYGGLCLKWTFQQYKNLGATNAAVGTSSCCAHYAATKMNLSTSDNIPIGALIFFDGVSKQGRCSRCGHYYGHVGIYVGDGYVSSIHGNGKIKNESISLWGSWGYRYMGWAIPKNVEINRDITCVPTPEIYDVRVENVRWDGYDVSCLISNEAYLTKVQFPTWTAYNDQDDLIWHDASKGQDGRWHYHVSVSDHKNEFGTYYTHLYAWATDGRYGVSGVSVEVPQKDETRPVISDIKIENLTSDGYRVSCKATDNVAIKRVAFPTYTKKNGGDDFKWHEGTQGSDGRWYYDVKRANHNGETGTYMTQIWAWDTNDLSSSSQFMTIDVPVPTISVVSISLNANIATLEVQKTLDLKATIAPGNATNKNVTWTTSDKTIATVINGKVTALKAGKATITVKSVSNPSVSASCLITVKAPVQNNRSSQTANKNDNSAKQSQKTEQTKAASVETASNPVSAVIGTELQYIDDNYVVTNENEVSFCNSGIEEKEGVIPSTIEVNGVTYRVTSIAKNAFKNNKSIKSITIGSNVVSIGKKAFYGCTKLKNIKIESSVLKSVGKNAFGKTSAKAKVTLLRSNKKAYKKLLKKSGISKNTKYVSMF